MRRQAGRGESLNFGAVACGGELQSILCEEHDRKEKIFLVKYSKNLSGVLEEIFFREKYL